MSALYIMATPIGNLEDFSLRGLRILKEVDLILSEDTRTTKKLLAHYQISKPTISYHQYSRLTKIKYILEQLKQDKDLALVSEAGTPGISDPGTELINYLVDCLPNLKIIPIPGPSALTTALSVSGLPTHRFLFIGFPPPKKEATRKLLHSLREERATLVFYLPTRRIISFLHFALETIGNRQIVIAREMTKIYEEFLRGNAEDLIEKLEGKNLKGEATILIQGQT